MVTLILDGINDANDFSEAVTAGKLSEHHHKKLVPACECLHILVPIVLFDDSIKYLFGKNSTNWLKIYFPVFMQVWIIFRPQRCGINSNRHALFLLTTY
jgi:hypothetical protein